MKRHALIVLVAALGSVIAAPAAASPPAASSTAAPPTAQVAKECKKKSWKRGKCKEEKRRWSSKRPRPLP
jgi:uncharacterized low-complexity protein